MNAWAQHEGQPGLGYIFWREGEESGAGPLAKNIGPERTKQIADQLGLGVGDAVFFIAGKPEQFVKFAGPARTKVGEEQGLIAKDRFDLCWIVDFPMYEWSEEEKKIDFSHNPFSMPNMDVDEFLTLDPAADRDKLLGINAIQYDIVCNGVELSSGAIRNHRPDVMKKAFAIAGYDESVLEAKFGGMLRALSLGAPPHGGIAPGIDRIVMLLCGEENLREVVLFPMNQRAEGFADGRAVGGHAETIARIAYQVESARQELGLRRCHSPLRATQGEQHDLKRDGQSGLCPGDGRLQRRDEPPAVRGVVAHCGWCAAAGPRRILGVAAWDALPSGLGRPDVDVALRQGQLAQAHGGAEGQRHADRGFRPVACERVADDAKILAWAAGVSGDWLAADETWYSGSAKKELQCAAEFPGDAFLQSPDPPSRSGPRADHRMRREDRRYGPVPGGAAGGVKLARAPRVPGAVRHERSE